MRTHGRSPDARPADEPGARWATYVASAIGADHIRAGIGNEDSAGAEHSGPGQPGGTGQHGGAGQPGEPGQHGGTGQHGGAGQPGGPDLVTFAVADGHGHARHFRSGRGSDLAITAGLSVASAWAARLDTAAMLSRQAAGQLITDVVSAWRQAVAADLAADPLTGPEAEAVEPGDPPEIPYGSTLLLGVIRGDSLVLAQIGDGDVLLVRPDGRYVAPVPADSRLDGTQTTSLCQPDAVSAFRVALVDLAASPVFAILAATDGYGNAQAVPDWRAAWAADLVRLGLDHGASWIGAQLGGWAEVCASADGSGDDTTIALVIDTTAALTRPAEHERRPAEPAWAVTLPTEIVPLTRREQVSSDPSHTAPSPDPGHTVPSHTVPSGTAPSGTAPSGTAPSGTAPSQTDTTSHIDLTGPPRPTSAAGPASPARSMEHSPGQTTVNVPLTGAARPGAAERAGGAETAQHARGDRTSQTGQVRHAETARHAAPAPGRPGWPPEPPPPRRSVPWQRLTGRRRWLGVLAVLVLVAAVLLAIRLASSPSHAVPPRTNPFSSHAPGLGQSHSPSAGPTSRPPSPRPSGENGMSSPRAGRRHHRHPSAPAQGTTRS